MKVGMERRNRRSHLREANSQAPNILFHPLLPVGQALDALSLQRTGNRRKFERSSSNTQVILEKTINPVELKRTLALILPEPRSTQTPPLAFQDISLRAQHPTSRKSRFQRINSLFFESR
ncbi:hypothetical protein ERO13_D02G112766v2 [Gossypium hirsutum]|uniref:Uncharacterized protein n=4 Tax=Gossypium TaxID=3633 RepID=A0A5D2VVG6_GOSMU|nr:hypothetical protein ERO13_D02G112766v2 [Gossypium hirsutum]TYH83628.1 hypothetical protein ES332_D02G144100v1 [Gossypium tomentosum]TYI93421.1 hypothetical protein E1A91_D02G134900v1 [Gossypium mustelinum]